MKFCDKCGSYMTETYKGFSCTKCGNLVSTEIVGVQRIKPSESSVDVVDESKKEEEYAKVTETCPQCGNPKAFHSLGLISGEHADVRQERSMERFTCTKCSYSWTK
ncbi:MAG: hypothetical protein ACLPY5_07000 [Candidatus Bathyarchaeia archaeon]